MKNHFLSAAFILSFLLFSHSLAFSQDTIPAAPAPDSADSGRQFLRPGFQSLSIAMVGDIMVGTTYPKTQLPKKDGKHIFEHVTPILSSADIAVGNCEGVFCKGGKCTKGSGPNVYAFRMPPSMAHLLSDAGFDFLSLANNHSNDFGRDGIRCTMRLLDSLGIGYAGVRNLCEYTVVLRDSLRVGYCAFGHNTHTCSHLDTSYVRSIVSALRHTCDLLIVSFHGGAEGKAYTHLPDGTEIFLEENRGSLRRLAHLCIDLGADLVYGHGPHVCRAMELYKGHLVAYSLGNFCTPHGINLSGISGYAPVVVANIDSEGRLISGRIHSFIQLYGKGPQPDNDNSVAAFIADLSLSDFSSPKLTFSPDGSFRPAE